MVVFHTCCLLVRAEGVLLNSNGREHISSNTQRGEVLEDYITNICIDQNEYGVVATNSFDLLISA